MTQVLALAMPFFGIILIGFLAGKLARLPRAGLAWLDFYLIYVALPALFFDILSRTPLEELLRWPFAVATTTSTFLTFLIALLVGRALSGAGMRVAALQGLVGSYANVGYMGPALTLSALGGAAAAPTALIFCFDVVLIFSLLPTVMAIFGEEKRPIGAIAMLILRRILTHPFILGSIAGVLGAASGVEVPEAVSSTISMLRASAAPAALFSIGVTVALQPASQLHRELPALVAVKLLVHPLMAWTMVTLVGGFPPVWVHAAVLMACLPPAATCYAAAQQSVSS
ncbi:AEC family transporter [Pleomorphomonas sp. JP5]|uniref:AEC family transporter n=1 Tax=Pleomorphomonas sp. JP5 TaxID=2942998 RepID=UPI0020433E97|nr:AEC family transporter [Pleomorphomonas sp. JP5]MCM5556084.1 AEC family transporter [Pleomorphomonas sp. JP5]